MISLGFPAFYDLSAFAEENATGILAFQNALRLRDQGRLLEAERQLITALSLDPSNPSYHFELANVYALWHDSRERRNDTAGAMQKLEASRKELQQVLMSDPDYIPALYNLAVIAKCQENYERSREEFKKILGLSRASGDAYAQINTLMQLGGTYEEQGFYHEALEAYQEARELDYHNLDILSAIENVKTLQKEGRIPGPDAFEVYERNLRRSRFGFTPGSRIQDLEQMRRDQIADGQGAMQVLPFLGMMLASQFMQLKDQFGEQEEDFYDA